MNHLLLDIEGTTTPISFVYDTLFPYARAQLDSYLRAHASDDDTREIVRMLASDAEIERRNDLPCPEIPENGTALERAEAAARVAQTLMERDRKATGLKQLQGRIWREGYEAGDIEGELFDDVADWMRTWSERGLPVSIYSSGSVEAQQLLFRYSDAGDLSGCIARYFDTTTGPKKRPESYQRIATLLELEPGDVVFCTDNLEEARAADVAGLRVFVSVRPGNPQIPDHPFPEIQSFDELDAAVSRQ